MLLNFTLIFCGLCRLIQNNSGSEVFTISFFHILTDLTGGHFFFLAIFRNIFFTNKSKCGTVYQVGSPSLENFKSRSGCVCKRYALVQGQLYGHATGIRG